MQWHGHSSYWAHTKQHFIVSFIYILKRTISNIFIFRDNKSAGRSVLVLLFPGRDETWFHCYTLLNKDCQS